MSTIIDWFLLLFQPKEFRALLKTVKSNKKNFEIFIYSTNIKNVRAVAESYREIWKLSSKELADKCDTEEKARVAYKVCHHEVEGFLMYKFPSLFDERFEKIEEKFSEKN